MRRRHLPVVFINDVDINSLFASLFTRSNLSSEVEVRGLYAFADPMFMFYQVVDGMVMTFGEEDCSFFCESCLPFPRGALNVMRYFPPTFHIRYDDFNPFAVCNRFSYFECIVMLIKEDQKYSIRAYAMRSVCYHFSGGMWSPLPVWIRLDNRFFVKGLYRWFAYHNKRPQDYIPEIEMVKSKLEEARQKGEYLYVKDRLVFDGLILATHIYSGQMGNAVYWSVDGICFNSLPSLKPNFRYIFLIPRCGRGRVRLTKENISDRTRFAQRFGRLWCQLIGQFLAQLSDQYLVSTDASPNVFYSGQMPLVEFYLENVFTFMLHRRLLTLECK